jgi:hypothetical protein
MPNLCLRRVFGYHLIVAAGIEGICWREGRIRSRPRERSSPSAGTLPRDGPRVAQKGITSRLLVNRF